MKIVFFETTEHAQGYLSQHLDNHDLKFIEYELTPNNCPKQSDVEIISVFVSSYINQAVLAQFPNVKLIVTRSTGFDHIDIQETQKRNIIVCNAPVYAAISVAEYTFALLLAVSRNIYASYHRIKEEYRFSHTSLTGFDLAGKTLGIVGTGHIGLEVIKRARAFEMNVIACDLHPQKQLAQELGFTYTSYEKLLQSSDILSYHVQLTPQTHHMLNCKNISQLKKGVYIINTARGQVIETQALVNGLKENIIAGAGLDVLEKKYSIKDPLGVLTDKEHDPQQVQTTLANHYLIDHPQVLVTPHNAFNTYESEARLLKSTAETITAFLEKKPINRVN